MADTVERESLPFDLGIEKTTEFDNPKMAENFLSGEVETATADPDEIQNIEEKETKPTQKQTPTKQAPPKKEKEESPEDPKDNLIEDPFEVLEESDEDEEKEEEKKTTQEEEDEDENTEEKEVNQFETLSKELLKLGVFTSPEEGEDTIPKTPQEFLARFQQEKQKGATEWLDSFLRRNGDDRMDLFEAIFVNNLDPREYLPTYNEVLDLEEMDMEQESNQEMVYREFYSRLGWDSEKIEKKLTKAKEYGDLEEESKDFYEKLLEQDKQKLQELELKKKKEIELQTRMDQQYKQSILNILNEKVKAKNFDGIPLTEGIKDKALDFLYTKKYKTPDGQLLTDFDKFIAETRRPENHELRVKMALLAMMNFDLSKVKKTAISEASDELFSSLAQKTVKTTKKSGSSKNASLGWKNFL